MPYCTKSSEAAGPVVSRRHHDNEIELPDDANRLPASTKRASAVDLTSIVQGARSGSGCGWTNWPMLATGTPMPGTVGTAAAPRSYRRYPSRHFRISTDCPGSAPAEALLTS